MSQAPSPVKQLITPHPPLLGRQGNLYNTLQTPTLFVVTITMVVIIML